MSEIPAELLIIIFKDLPDFDSLFATIRTCRRLYQCFTYNDVGIITSIASNIHQRAIQLDHQVEQDFHNRGSSLIIRQLILASKMGCIPRYMVLQFFANARTFLEMKGLQSLLIHVGISTGLVKRGRPKSSWLNVPQETEKILHKKGASIWGRKLYIRPHTSVAQSPVALITDDGMLFFKSSVQIPDGMYNETGFTLIRMENTPRPCRVYRRSELNDVTQRQPKLFRLLNTLDRFRIMQHQNCN